jgi:hypothetical protein
VRLQGEEVRLFAGRACRAEQYHEQIKALNEQNFKIDSFRDFL